MAEYTVQDPQGNEHVLEGPEGATDQEILQQAQTLLAPGKLESFGRGALNNFPLANQAVSALSPGDYSKNMEDLTSKAASAKAANPVSYGAGAVTGAVAPLAIPGVGEALEAAPIAGNAALGAASAISNTDVTKDPGEALKQAGEGALLGGATAGVIGKFAPEAEALEGASNKNAVEAMGMSPGYLAHLDPEEIQDIGKFAKDADLINGSLPDRLARAQDIKGQFGQQIEELGAGATPGSAIDTADLEAKMQKWAGLAGTEPRANVNTYKSGIQNLKSLGDAPTFDQLQEMKSMYGEMAFDQNHQVRNKAAADIYGVLKDSLKSTVNAAPDDLQNVLTGYKNASDMTRALEKMAGKEAATGKSPSQGIGFMGRIIGNMPGQSNPAINIPTAAAIGAMGHPMWGAMAATPTLTNPAILSNIQGAAAKALPTAEAGLKMLTTDSVTSHLLKTLTTNPQSLGKFAQPLMKAAQEGGSQGIAATHFILSSQYPEYNEMIMKQGDSNAQ